MFEERQKLFQEVVQVLAKVMIPQGAMSQEAKMQAPTCGGSAAMKLGRDCPEPPCEPIIPIALERTRDLLSEVEEAVERLFGRTESVTFPAGAMVAGGTPGNQVAAAIPPIAENIGTINMRLERVAGRIVYLIGRLGL